MKEVRSALLPTKRTRTSLASSCFFDIAEALLRQAKEAPGNIFRQRTQNISGLKLDWDGAALREIRAFVLQGCLQPEIIQISCHWGWMPGPTPLAVKR